MEIKKNQKILSEIAKILKKFIICTEKFKWNKKICLIEYWFL
jgi:hypothetical protein